MAFTSEVSRRTFLHSTAVAAALSLLRQGSPALAALASSAQAAMTADTGFTTLSANEAADIDAITARILPTTDTPGAREAGVVHFFDRALAQELSDALPPLRAFIDHLNSGLDGQRFASLNPLQQDELLILNQQDERFELCRVMTLFGFFAMPSYGGNRDHVGWELIGFKGHQGAWAPPFGYYDAHYPQGSGTDE
ncbi:gluconate 2-dehydrogenase subunit 3 family protein [Parahaliea maris]|uniref:Gluconate 2-dehydrogenase subunit 3 family protein n=1 Tax=Parahaliea maris TaxID=2716870 RepID=A0A5C9A6I2_9GAMM|nr:gluconate 2-dehydrogenase subunit 3 family protein [Parahaliea maris]TXS96545.1 gluconate 2-dehydrogenase subunit 3 family protein [Parahaliea maris]